MHPARHFKDPWNQFNDHPPETCDWSGWREHWDDWYLRVVYQRHHLRVTRGESQRHHHHLVPLAAQRYLNFKGKCPQRRVIRYLHRPVQEVRTDHPQTVRYHQQGHPDASHKPAAHWWPLCQCPQASFLLYGCFRYHLDIKAVGYLVSTTGWQNKERDQ